MKFTLSIPFTILIVYLLTNLFVPRLFKGTTIFLVDALLWAIPIFVTILHSKLCQTSLLRTDTTVITLAGIIAVFQIFLAIFVGFFMGFGKNPSIWTPTTLTVYFPFLFVPFFALELSRGYLATAITRHKPTLSLLTISLFYTIIISTIPTYLGLVSPLSVAEFLIRTFIPSLAISLLASYFAFLGGFPANLIYMAMPAFFTWFSPMLPNPTWQVQSVLTVVAAATGFMVLDTAVKPLSAKNIRRTLKKQKSQLPYWTAITLIGLVAVWSSTGLLGFTPTIIASGSMQPAVNLGDIVLVINAPPNTIKVGDIIQYRTSDVPTIHRVIDTYTSTGTLWFVTQGDANNAPDPPISQDQVMGKIVFTIPQLGWVSIAIKDFAANTYTFFTTTVPQTLTNAGSFILTNGVYITAALAFTAYSYLLLTYKQIKKEEKT
jgi:signal peptidase